MSILHKIRTKTAITHLSLVRVSLGPNTNLNEYQSNSEIMPTFEGACVEAAPTQRIGQNPIIKIINRPNLKLRKIQFDI